MKSEFCKISYEEKKYYFNVKTHDVLNAHFEKIPKAELHEVRRNKLNPILREGLLSKDDATLQKHASVANEVENYELAGDLVEVLLNRDNRNPVAMAIRCSLLRAQNKPKEAYFEWANFERIGGKSTHAVLTSVAAALVDLKEIDEARRFANRAYAMLGGKATDHLRCVYSAIRAATGEKFVRA